MSFQGDVGGIGLADLLQSLARGRDGVLYLLGKHGLKSTLGFQEGQLQLLPDPDEDPEMWRQRVRSAWVKDGDTRIDSLRMNEIARAQRLETLYCALDSEGLHFRFAPGPLPTKPTESALGAAETGMQREGTRRDAVFVPGMSVEGMLLEYARMKDEAQSAGLEWPQSEDAVLVLLDDTTNSKEVARFFSECDGSSSLSEIADRMGMPLRQLRITAISELKRGAVRLAGHEELLNMVQHEASVGYVGRAAARLRAWLLCAPFGPMPTVEAQVLQTEWEAGRLQPVLRELATPELRTFLRRFDCALGVPLLALDHWNEYARVRRDDRITQVRLVHLQAIASADPNVPAIRDLLAMGHAFLAADRCFAAAAVLRIAAERTPESNNVRLELGAAMLQAGMGLEAGPWILEAATALLEEGHAEKVLQPLREYVAIDPAHREARRLLARARTHAVQRTLVKRNSLVAIAVLLALSIGAVVQFRSQRAFEEKLEAVNARLDDPREALRILDAQFPGDESSRVGELRKTLVEKRRIADLAGRTAWMDRYREAQVESNLGDPVLGLRRILELPAAPVFGPEEEPLPLTKDLFNTLAARIETLFVEMGPKVDESAAQLKAESRCSMLLEELRGVILKSSGRPEAMEFVKRIDAFVARVDERVELRRGQRAERANKENLAQQDILIGAARAHSSAGDYERSLQLYDELLAKDTTGKLAGLVATEMKSVRDKGQALTRAHDLARAGRHADAHQLLVAALGEIEASTVDLIWKVESFPTGARVKLPDGTERVTPFTVQSSWNEPVDLTVEMPGFDAQVKGVEHPSDQMFRLSRAPERAWKPAGRVESLPVKVGEDHVVCARNGRIARLSRSETPVWSHDLKSLGGVARSPVFLPQHPGRLLIVTEDGEAWIVEASSGVLEGPWNYGVPPVLGPELVEGGARVNFRDGASFEWTNRLKPEQVAETSTKAQDSPKLKEDEGSTSGLAVLRRRSSSTTTLVSPWTEFDVVVTAEAFVVRKKSDQSPAFVVQRDGDWTYVAWEGPHALAPHGRLWVSDGRGLRSFLP